MTVPLDTQLPDIRGLQWQVKSIRAWSCASLLSQLLSAHFFILDHNFDDGDDHDDDDNVDDKE